MVTSNHISISIRVITYTFWALLVTSCGSSIEVKRGTAEKQTELTGKWNSNDSRLVSKKMINSMLNSHWLSKHLKKHRKEPTVIVGKFRNLSHEIINVATFIADIERIMINSGEVDFVASEDERGQVRSERMDQEFHANRKTRKAMGKEIGADYMLTGTLNSFVEKVEGTKNIQYQIDLTLISLKNNRKVWVGSQKHAKTIERSSFKLW